MSEPVSWEALAALLRRRFPRVRNLDVEALCAWLASDAFPPLLLDARAPEEFAVSHLPGARPAPDVAAALAALEGEPRDRPIVVYCSVGWRSAVLADALGELGFSAARNLEGSLFAWANRGLPVVRTRSRDGAEREEPADDVHPFGLPWSLLLDPARRARPSGGGRGDAGER